MFKKFALWLFMALFTLVGCEGDDTKESSSATLIIDGVEQHFVCSIKIIFIREGVPVKEFNSFLFTDDLTKEEIKACCELTSNGVEGPTNEMMEKFEDATTISFSNDGEGISGIEISYNDTHYYKENISNETFNSETFTDVDDDANTISATFSNNGVLDFSYNNPVK